MERRLRSAIDAGVLQVHYQPVVDLPSGRVTGVEALARWDDEELGSVPPDRFIPLAETTGLIIDLGRWVLNTACMQAATWQGTDSELPGPTVAVNVSPLQLTENTFIQDVIDALSSSGLPAHRLCIEITETAAISDMEKTARVLTRLRDLSIQIALDDFGTGHSSLTMLRRLPVTLVKIDRSFVTKIATDAQDAVLARLIIDAAHSLGMRVCAEGIENASQASQLIAMGCDFAQGWLFGKPQPASPALTRILAGSTDNQASPDESHHRLALTGSDELVIVSSAQHLITYVSSTSTTILGWTPAQLIGTPMMNHLHPQDLATDQGWSALPALLREGTATHQVRHRNGSYRWLQATSQHLYDDMGQLREVLTVCQDVTAVTSAQLALASSEDRFRHAFDDAPFAMALSGMDGTFLRVNTAFADLIGAHPDHLLTMTVDDITHPDDRLTDAANLAAYTTGQKTSHDLTKRYQRIDGSIVILRVRAALVLDREGAPAYVIAHVNPGGCDQCGRGSA
jgi:PAS domain S-box-containing protein